LVVTDAEQPAVDILKFSVGFAIFNIELSVNVYLLQKNSFARNHFNIQREGAVKVVK